MTQEKHLYTDLKQLSALVKSFQNDDARDAYVSTLTRNFLAMQMREFRGEKSQTEFGEFIGKRQTVVSRMEDPNYGKWTLQTLFDTARKLKVAVFVRFVDFQTFLEYSGIVSPGAIKPTRYNKNALEEYVEEKEIAQPEKIDLESQEGLPNFGGSTLRQLPLSPKKLDLHPVQ